jgi:hypothetical protein
MRLRTAARAGWWRSRSALVPGRRRVQLGQQQIVQWAWHSTGHGQPEHVAQFLPGGRRVSSLAGVVVGRLAAAVISSA